MSGRAGEGRLDVEMLGQLLDNLHFPYPGWRISYGDVDIYRDDADGYVVEISLCPKSCDRKTFATYSETIDYLHSLIPPLTDAERFEIQKFYFVDPHNDGWLGGSEDLWRHLAWHRKHYQELLDLREDITHFFHNPKKVSLYVQYDPESQGEPSVCVQVSPAADPNDILLWDDEFLDYKCENDVYMDFCVSGDFENAPEDIEIDWEKKSERNMKRWNLPVTINGQEEEEGD